MLQGPLTYSDNGGAATVVGVVSWGIGCGQRQYPGVYSRVTSALDWIKMNMNWRKNTFGDLKQLEFEITCISFIMQQAFLYVNEQLYTASFTRLKFKYISITERFIKLVRGDI